MCLFYFLASTYSHEEGLLGLLCLLNKLLDVLFHSNYNQPMLHHKFITSAFISFTCHLLLGGTLQGVSGNTVCRICLALSQVALEFTLM